MGAPDAGRRAQQSPWWLTTVESQVQPPSPLLRKLLSSTFVVQVPPLGPAPLMGTMAPMTPGFIAARPRSSQAKDNPHRLIGTLGQTRSTTSAASLHIRRAPMTENRDVPTVVDALLEVR